MYDMYIDIVGESQGKNIENYLHFYSSVCEQLGGGFHELFQCRDGWTYLSFPSKYIF